MRSVGSIEALTIFLFGVFQAADCFAVSGYLRPTGGLMTQPASQFYHAVYGLTGDLSNESQTLIGRAVYLERPKFKANGFEDQDSGSFVLIGTKITKGKDHGLAAFVGGGSMGGYIKDVNSGDTDNLNDTIATGRTQRTYRMPGLCASIEYAGEWKALTGSIGHQTFIGYGTKDQRDALVAWPFNFLFATLGVKI